MWDKTTSRARILTSELSARVAAFVWTHQGDRLAVATGEANPLATPAPQIPSVTLIDVTTGQTTTIPQIQGVPASWSPDDQFLAVHQDTICTGDDGCFGYVTLLPASADHIVRLGRFHDVVPNEQWTTQPDGYTYDHWVLHKNGQPVSAVAAQDAPVLSWSPDGHYALAQTATPSAVALGSSDTKPAQLTLWSLAGPSTVVDSEDVHAEYLGVRLLSYRTVWSPDGQHFAYASPFRAAANLFLGSPGHAGQSDPVPLQQAASIASRATTTPLEFSADGQTLLFSAPGARMETDDIYRYDLITHQLSKVAITTSSAALQPSSPLSPSVARLLAMIEHLRKTTDANLDRLLQDEAQRQEAVRYFNAHYTEDSLNGFVTVLADALAVRGAAHLWQEPVSNFLEAPSLTHTKALLAEAAKHTEKDAVNTLLKAGLPAAAAGLLAWIVKGDGRYKAALQTYVQGEQARVNAVAGQAAAAQRAHPPSPAAASALLQELATVTSANERLPVQMEAMMSLLATTYALRKGTQENKGLAALLTEFVKDESLFWGLTALSIPVGGWGGVAYKGTKLALDALLASAKVREDALMTLDCAATSLAAQPLLDEVTQNALLSLGDAARGAPARLPAGRIMQVQGMQQGGLLGPSGAQLAVTVTNSGARPALYQAIVTYQHLTRGSTVYLTGYPVTYLAKSVPVTIAPGQSRTLLTNFKLDGQGVLPSEGTGMVVIVLGQQGQGIAFAGQQALTWHPSSNSTNCFAVEAYTASGSSALSNGVCKQTRTKTSGSPPSPRAVFDIPTAHSGLAEMIAARNGNLWFAEAGAHKIGLITTQGIIHEFTVRAAPGTGHSIGHLVIGPDGSLWFVDTFGAQIGHMTVQGNVTLFKVPSLPGDSTVFGPLPAGIAVRNDGDIQYLDPEARRLVRVTLTGTLVSSLVLPGYGANDITTDAEGNFWITQGCHACQGQVVRVTPAGQETVYTVGGGLPSNIIPGPNRSIWFSSAFSGEIGEITVDGQIHHFSVTTGFSNGQRSQPALEDIAVAPNGSVWFTAPDAGLSPATKPGYIGELLPRGHIRTIPISGDSIAIAPNGAIWLSDEDHNRIMRFSVLPLPTEPQPPRSKG